LSAGFGLMGTMNMNRLRRMEINSPDMLKISDGIYDREFNNGGGIYYVEVEVIKHRISNVVMKTERRSPYVRYAQPVTNRIIEK
jgi:hypothetical protein